MNPKRSEPDGASAPTLRRELLLAALFPLVTFGFLAILSSSSVLNALALNLILERNVAEAQVMAGALEPRLAAAVGPLQDLAQALATGPTVPAAQAQTLAAAAPALQGFNAGVLLLDPGGGVIAASPGREAYLGHNFSQLSEVQRAAQMGTLVFSGLARDEISGQLVIRIAVPVIRAGQGRPVGLLLALLAPQASPVFSHLGPGTARHAPSQTVYLVDGANTILFHPDPAQIGQPGPNAPVVQRLEQNQQAGSMLGEVASGQGQAIIAFVSLPTQGWKLIMEQPWDTALAPVLNYQGALALLLVLGITLSLVMLSLRTNRLTRPLTQLAEQAAQLGPGSTFRPQKAQGPREVRQLMRAFNQMVIRLAQQQGALREYAMQVLQSQEEERRRIARDLHDETIQDLVALIQRIELCRAGLEREPAAMRPRLEDLRRLAEEALADVRQTVRDLRPPVLDDLGLGAALDGLCAALRELAPATEVRYVHEGPERRLAPEAELAVYRILQEALANVRRHAAQATLVEVRLSFSPTDVTAQVVDNGPGFVMPGPPALLRAGHWGLMGMLERAQLVGAQLSIQSAPGQGMSVTLRL